MDELKNFAPKLSKLKKENPFGTPDKYFDNFSAQLQVKLEAEKKVVPKQKHRIIKLLKPALGLAASFALIFMLVYWPLNNFMSKEVAEINIEESNIEEMEFLSMVEGIDENSFYALLDEPNGSNEFTDEDLISYLSVNVSEYELYAGTDNYN